MKVQRPGVAEAIERELDILRRLADLFDGGRPGRGRSASRSSSFGFDERTREELDFRIEATNESLAARATGEGDAIVVPAVIEGLSTQRFLVEERAPAGAWGPRRRSRTGTTRSGPCSPMDCCP